MHVGVDHIADRQGGHRTDRPAQPLAFDGAAAGIDHRHRRLADDEADIGDAAFVLRRRLGLLALMDVDAGRHLLHRQWHDIRGQRRRQPAAEGYR
jgi:hypothetical protein